MFAHDGQEVQITRKGVYRTDSSSWKWQCKFDIVARHGSLGHQVNNMGHLSRPGHHFDPV